MIKYLLILLLVTGTVSAQQLPGSFLSPNPGARGVTYNGLKSLREFYLPQYDTAFTPSWEGAIVYRMDDQTPYIYRGAKWQVMSGFYSDSAARVAVGGSYRAKWFGILGNGTDQTALINSTLSSLPIGSTLELEPNTTYKAASKIIIPKPVRLIGNNGTINYTGTGIAISIQSSDVEIGYLKFRGQDSSYIAFSEAIATEGSTNTSFYNNIDIHDCEITNYHSSGIYLNFVNNFRLNRNNISKQGYAGMLLLSVTRGDVSWNKIRNITTNITGNAYGIAVSKKSVATDTVPHDVTIIGNQIDSVLSWEGIDTHGGHNLVVLANIINDVKYGISLVNLNTPSNGNSSPSFTITGNVINNEAITGSKAGITVQGDTINLSNGTITGNTIYGSYITLTNTQGVTMNGNTLIRPYLYGIYLKQKNYGLSIKGTTVIDVWREGINSDCGAIGITQGYIFASIEGNVLLRGSKDTTGVTINKFGYLDAIRDTTNQIVFGLNDFNAATTPYINNLDVTNVIGDIVTPTYSTPIGSIYRQRRGSANFKSMWIRDQNGWGYVLTNRTPFTTLTVTGDVFVNQDTTLTGSGVGITNRSYKPYSNYDVVYPPSGSFARNVVNLRAGQYTTSITNLVSLGFYGALGYPTSSVFYGYLGAGSDVDFENHNMRVYPNKTVQFYDAVGVGMGPGGTTLVALNPYAILDIQSTTKGVLFPRMNRSQFNAITPTKGNMAYDKDNNKFLISNGASTLVLADSGTVNGRYRQIADTAVNGNSTATRGRLQNGLDSIGSLVAHLAGTETFTGSKTFNATTTANAGININSTTEGFGLPQMTTTQRDAIVSPRTGLQIYNTILRSVDTYKGSGWAVNGILSALSSATTLSLSTAYTDYVFIGTTATWTLMAMTGNTHIVFNIKNRGSGTLTINSNAGGNDIFLTSAVNTISLAPGESVRLLYDGTFIDVE